MVIINLFGISNIKQLPTVYYKSRCKKLLKNSAKFHNDTRYMNIVHTVPDITEEIGSLRKPLRASQPKFFFCHSLKLWNRNAFVSPRSALRTDARFSNSFWRLKLITMLARGWFTVIAVLIMALDFDGAYADAPLPPSWQRQAS